MSSEAAGVDLEPSVVRCGPVGHAIFRVARLHRMIAGQLLREVGLHPSQELVMMELWARGPLRQVDLGELVGSDPATVTRTVRRLEQSGFVRRVPSPTDKRSMIVEPTAVSLALRSKVEDIWSRLEQSAVGDLTEAEQADTLAILDRLERNLAQATAEIELDCSDCYVEDQADI
ncbi:MarR family winged helix-turn-helix transcriptional regulator [Streptomyces sp. NPDC002088]|uniref:MarR family winged helix-turn-helix transcriptional regulator n=1 Tax=Streptomyces sp. NPDC002088 TaxID=3154665 RepID=UPI00332775CE